MSTKLTLRSRLLKYFLISTKGAHDLRELMTLGDSTITVTTVRQREESGTHAPHLVLTLEQTNNQISPQVDVADTLHRVRIAQICSGSNSSFRIISMIWSPYSWTKSIHLSSMVSCNFENRKLKKGFEVIFQIVIFHNFIVSYSC